MLLDIKPYQGILIEWLDASASVTEGGKIAEIKARSVVDQLTWTVGFFLKIEDDVLLISTDKTPDEDQPARGIIRIPMKIVIKAWKLKSGGLIYPKKCEMT